MSNIKGRIIGTSSLSGFTFASNEYCEDDYVKVVDGTDGITICEIVNKKVLNKYLENPDVLKYIQKDEDITKDAMYFYEAVPIAFIRDGQLYPSKKPFLPGEFVYNVDENSLALAYGITNGNIKIGNTLNKPVCDVRMMVDQIFNPHVSIIGRTGSGKSYFTRKLIASFSNDEANIVIFSPSDEYNEACRVLGFNLLYSESIVLQYDLSSIRYLYNLNISEEKLLGQIKLDKDKCYSSEDISMMVYDLFADETGSPDGQISLYEEVKKEVKLPQYATTLINKLRGKKLNFSLDSKKSSIIRDGSVVVDMSENSQEEQECILNQYFYQLLSGRKNNSRPKKTIIVIEEAHNYAPSIKTTLCKDIIVKAAREGRKAGISLCLITQRPRNFDQTVLSQCSNIFMFCVPHPDDISHVLQVAPQYDEKLSYIVQQLDTGECVVLGSSFKKPLTFKVG